MPEDLEIEWGQTRHETMPQRNGTFKRSTVYTFWIGLHGPFTERTDRESDDDGEIRRRAERLRDHLRSLPR